MEYQKSSRNQLSLKYECPYCKLKIRFTIISFLNHLTDNHQDIEVEKQKVEIGKFSREISLKEKRSNLKGRKNSINIKYVKKAVSNILREKNIESRLLKGIAKIQSEEKIQLRLYLIAKDNNKLIKEFIQKGLLKKSFIDKKTQEGNNQKQELAEKGLLRRKDWVKKVQVSTSNENQVKGQKLRIIYTPMGNKR